MCGQKLRENAAPCDSWAAETENHHLVQGWQSAKYSGGALSTSLLEKRLLGSRGAELLEGSKEIRARRAADSGMEGMDLKKDYERGPILQHDTWLSGSRIYREERFPMASKQRIPPGT